MSEISKITESHETQREVKEGFMTIKATGDIGPESARRYIEDLFEGKAIEAFDHTPSAGEVESGFETLIDSYMDDLREKSDCPETIPQKPFEAKDVQKRSPEENAKMREEFADSKYKLKQEWETANGKPWPKYQQDIYSNGKLIRKAGNDYDAHHILPLGLGGKNEASNITPISAEVHYDKQGVHAQDSPYSLINNAMGGADV